MKHHLAAILYADVVGYSRLTGLDEEATHKKLDASLNLLTNIITAHDGQAMNEAGDALLAEFQSVTAAVDAATDFQNQMAERHVDESKDSRFEFRIGINLGEVIHNRDDVYGDGVRIRWTLRWLKHRWPNCLNVVVGQDEQIARENGAMFFSGTMSEYEGRSILDGARQLRQAKVTSA